MDRNQELFAFYQKKIKSLENLYLENKTDDVIWEKLKKDLLSFYKF